MIRRKLSCFFILLFGFIFITSCKTGKNVNNPNLKENSQVSQEKPYLILISLKKYNC